MFKKHFGVHHYF